MNIETEIKRALLQLVGLQLGTIRRVADMSVWHFGTMRPAPESSLPFFRDKPRGTVGEFALHIQCPWRPETNDGIVTGRSDLWEPVVPLEDSLVNDWNYERDGNLQDARIKDFLAGSSGIVAEYVELQLHGSFTIVFSSGHRLVVFSSGAKGEAWRLFRPATDQLHFVISGGRIEE